MYSVYKLYLKRSSAAKVGRFTMTYVLKILPAISSISKLKKMAGIGNQQNLFRTSYYFVDHKIIILII